jgi:hypothetical protein
LPHIGWLMLSGTIIAILVSLKDRPLARWPLGLTIINVLSKIASAALILPISEAIGQLKWLWFYGKTSKDAFDFEIFDKASRGAWGSFLLLCRTKGRSLAAVGAILTLLLVAMDTFFQQTTDLPTRSTLHGIGLIPRTIRYEPSYSPEFMSGFESTQSDQNMLAVANAFFTTNGTQPVVFGNGTRPDIPLSCPTSTCTWPAYDSLGLCSQCVELPQLLVYACLNTRVDWTSDLNSTISSYPNATVCGYYLNATSSDPILMSGYILGENKKPQGETLVMRTLPLLTNPLRDPLWGGSIMFKDLRNPIIDVLISSTLDRSQVHANVPPVLHECVLTFCVKTFESSYSLGTYHEQVKNIYRNDSGGSSSWSTFTYEDSSTDQTYLENVTISAPSTGSHFPEHGWGIGNGTMLITTLVFDRMFPAFTTVADETARGLLRWRLGHPSEVRTKLLKMNPWLLPNNVTHHFERLATALTNVIRSDLSSTELVVGDAFTNETYVAVHWAWLTFPLAMLALSTAFLIATVVKTSEASHGDVGIWKTSAMPALIYSLPQDVRPNLASTSTWRSENSGGAKRVKIRLKPGQGWRVSGHVITSPKMLASARNNSAPAGWL